MVLAEAASVAHTHQGHPALRGLAVHLRLKVLAHAARGLVENSQRRASLQHHRPGQPRLLARTKLAVPENGGRVTSEDIIMLCNSPVFWDTVSVSGGH